MTATKLLLTASPVRAVTPGAEHRRTIRHVVAASHRLLRQRIDGVRRADVGLRDLEGLFQALRRLGVLFFASVSNCTRPWAFGARRG
jgi:hypothetical protein